MDCISFQKMIPACMEESLSPEDLNAFLNHLDTCSSCHDELEIHYIVAKGVQILDEPDGDYDLKSAFQRFVRSSHTFLQERKAKRRVSYVVDTLVFWALVFSALILYFHFYGSPR